MSSQGIQKNSGEVIKRQVEYDERVEYIVKQLNYYFLISKSNNDECRKDRKNNNDEYRDIREANKMLILDRRIL